jgi:dTDP-4-dehydrorhamnose reductase
MKVLVLGGEGMLGHKMSQVLSQQFETYVTMRQPASAYSHYGIFDLERTIGRIDCLHFDSIVKAIGKLKPDVIVNCIGIVKQVIEEYDLIETLTVNSIFPHRLKNLCSLADTRLIHFSTDCVFSGQKGMYKEEDESDAADLYGRSKYLGEVDCDNCLTLRTSIIGRELNTKNGLLEWFLSNDGGTVKGYSNVIFSGFPTVVLADILAKVIRDFPNLNGILHISSDQISKFDLLQLIADEYQLRIKVKPFADYSIDRSLDSNRFRNKTGIIPPEWPELIKRMKKDPTPYDNWRIK